MNIRGEVTLRKVCKNDRDLLFEWVNEQAVRNASFTQAKITKFDHLKWFERVIASTEIHIYIMEIDGIPIGQIRFEQSTNRDTIEIDYSISKNFRGKGLGKEIIKRGMEKHWLQDQHEADYVAKVKPENIASQKSFLNAGFTICDETNHMIIFRRTVHGKA